jgi:hypothetical protein
MKLLTVQFMKKLSEDKDYIITFDVGFQILIEGVAYKAVNIDRSTNIVVFQRWDFFTLTRRYFI